MKSINLKQELLNYLFIISGSFALAFGVVGFLSPNKIATGGTAGLAIVFHYLTNLPTGTLLALINIPLLLVSVKYLGKYFAIKTIVAIILIGVFIDLLAEFIGLPALSNEPLLATLYGGVIIGIGLGLIFKGGASAGGGTIIAKIVTSKTNMKTGNVILFLDVIVVVLAGIVFKSVELALWSMISIFAASKLIDTVLTGRQSEKIVHISSSKNLSDLSTLIDEALHISGTIVKGNDLALNENKDIIFIVVPNNRLNTLKNLVFVYDNNAKMIVMEATEMLSPTRK
ncbi:YitT family protein [Vicingus serpentipes]|uniref:YitT family protein n=1 Tax=Vicingus serpentipes TaxID=1926625 RepID=A0A5C6RUY9_9FLAO|nr:YitT family protein [Vicingus serpentipes]TXB65864.1 YitT family protein [Vicingus serpentipes]